MLRNITLDYFKLFLSFLVIFIHLPIYPDIPIGSVFIRDGISRIAVPCFFIINGYFLASIITDKIKFRQYIRRLITIYVVWMIIYSGFYVKKMLYMDFINILLTLFFGNGHIWYIAALIYASFLLKLIMSLNKYIILSLSFILFLFGFFIYTLPLFNYSSFNNSIEYLYYLRFFLIRNFLFIGFPFLFIGYFIHNNAINLPKKLHVTLIIILLILLLFESFFLFNQCINKGVTINNDFRLSLIFLCPLIVLFFLKYPLIKENDAFASKLASTTYFIHPLIIFILGERFWNYQFYFIIVIISVLLGTVLITLNKKFKFFF